MLSKVVPNIDSAENYLPASALFIGFVKIFRSKIQVFYQAFSKNNTLSLPDSDWLVVNRNLKTLKLSFFHDVMQTHINHDAMRT